MNNTNTNTEASAVKVSRKITSLFMWAAFAAVIVGIILPFVK
jgi:hypothetical protein